MNKSISKVLFCFLVASLSLVACSEKSREANLKERQARAKAMWQERCKKSGEFIHKTATGVEGVFLMKLRSEKINYGDQFALDDPYGSDLLGDGYIKSFLRGSFRLGKPNLTAEPGDPPRIGYRYVEAIDPVDNKRYRYTGRIEEPWQKDKSFLKGYVRFAMDKTPALLSPPRYGVTYEDISTREEREYWIAGSSLKVIDTQTSTVIAERIGYMFDWGQGDQSGGRSPWLLAADNACPDFHRFHNQKYREPGSAAQAGQAQDFVEKVLQPIK